VKLFIKPKYYEMIVDYNYKKNMEEITDTGIFTISRKNNRGFIYYPGVTDLGSVIWPLIKFVDENDTITSFTPNFPTGSFFEGFMQFKQRSDTSGRYSDFNFVRDNEGQIAGTDGLNNSLFMPICFYSMEFDIQISDPGLYVLKPFLITLY
jgi:hypothetical protein